jgi:hypothetical protein
MVRIISRSIVALFAVVMAAFLLLFALWSSGEESFGQGVSHARSAQVAKFKPLKMCEYDGAKGPCGCPDEVNTEGDFVEGVDKHDVAVTTSTHYVHPGTVYKWKVKHLVICVAYEEYEPTPGSFPEIRIKTGPQSGERVAQHELADLVLWMRPKR